VLDSIVHDALKSLAKDENKIILKVNPTDVEYTKEIVPKLLSSGQFEAKIFVSGDKDVEEGSAIIETSNGVIDANISTQLDLIKEAFKQI
jgi:flagellar assembly protein fliH